MSAANPTAAAGSFAKPIDCAALAAQGWDIGRSAGQIIPIVLGEARAALDVAERLFAAGLYVPAIRPPSVPLGQSRLRISLSAGHDTAMISRLEQALAELSIPPSLSESRPTISVK